MKIIRISRFIKGIVNGFRFGKDLYNKSIFQMLTEFKGFDLGKQIDYCLAAANCIDKGRKIVYETIGTMDMIYIHDRMCRIIEENVIRYKDEYGEEKATEMFEKAVFG